MIITEYVEIEIKHGNTINYYKLKGYDCKKGDVLVVRVEDLPSRCRVKVMKECEECHKQKEVEYVNAHSKLCMECNRSIGQLGEKHHAYTDGGKRECIDCGELVSKHKDYDRCRTCSDKLRGGENHYRWKEDRTQLLTRSGSQMEKWSNFIKRRDGNKCVLCSADDKPLESHHLVAYSTDQSLGYDTDNGVCLCNSCHRDFHVEYGYGQNTAEQFELFALNKREVA